MTYYFYSRVSSITQSSNRQLETFKNLSYFNSNNLYVDKVSGNVPFLERKEAIILFDVMTSNNDPKTLVVDSIDRLGRNLIDILKTIDRFSKNGINLKSLKEGFETLLEDGSENPMAKMAISVMGTIAENQRNSIKRNQAEGIALNKHKFVGRKIGSTQSDERLLERHQVVVSKIKKGLSIRDISSIVGCSTGTRAKS